MGGRNELLCHQLGTPQETFCPNRTLKLFPATGVKLSPEGWPHPSRKGLQGQTLGQRAQAAVWTHGAAGWD